MPQLQAQCLAKGPANTLTRPICSLNGALQDDPSQLSFIAACVFFLAEQLEEALASAHQRIAELEALVESLEATVQSLKEALAAAIGHAGQLQVTVAPPSWIALLGAQQDAHLDQDILLKLLSPALILQDHDLHRLQEKPCLALCQSLG